MTTLPYRDGGFVRFTSERTGETLFEITMVDGSMIIWGAHYRPDEFSASLADDGATVSVAGMLRDRIGPVQHCVELPTGVGPAGGGLRPFVEPGPYHAPEEKAPT